MIKLSRVYLYKILQKEIENCKERSKFEDELLLALRVNLDVLSKVEYQFLTVDLQPGEFYDSQELSEYQFTVEDEKRFDLADQLKQYLKTNRDRNNESDKSWRNTEKVQSLISRLLSLVGDDDNVDREDNIQEKSNNPVYSRNMFNKIINTLCDFNYTFFSVEDPPFPTNSHKLPQIFFSHAYVDKLYSYALFRFFLKEGVFLYVDWMHEEAQHDGRKLKKTLERELSRSEQLLFLRTINSELNIQGKHVIRQWCAWVIGNYYMKKSHHVIRSNSDGVIGKKYLLNLYSTEPYRNDLHLHGFRTLTSIRKDGLLEGIEIAPLGCAMD